jgi:hypothetical protein
LADLMILTILAIVVVSVFVLYYMVGFLGKTTHGKGPVTLLVASSLRLHSHVWPLLFVIAGGVSLTVAMLWFVGTGGAELA